MQRPLLLIAVLSNTIFGISGVLAISPQDYVLEHGDPSNYTFEELREFKEARATTILPKPNIEAPAAIVRRLYGEDLTPSFMLRMMLRQGTATSRVEPDTRNEIGFDSFYTGDIVVARNAECKYWAVPCYFSHAAMFDFSYYIPEDENSRALWSAYPSGGAPSDDDSTGDSLDGKLGRQTVASIHNYGQAAGLYVPEIYEQEEWEELTTYVSDNKGEDYFVFSRKENTDQWYCSKVAWAAYFNQLNIDIDFDGGYFVMPDDLVLDEDVELFAVDGSI